MDAIRKVVDFFREGVRDLASCLTVQSAAVLAAILGCLYLYWSWDRAGVQIYHNQDSHAMDTVSGQADAPGAAAVSSSRPQQHLSDKHLDGILREPVTAM